MTQRTSLTSRQDAAGAPIQAQAQSLAPTQADYNTFNNLVVGVTTTSTPPATFSDFTHAIVVPWNAGAAGVQAASWSAVVKSQDTVLTSYSEQASAALFIPLDSNFVVGRYLWVASFDGVGPTDAPTSLSAPYLIR